MTFHVTGCGRSSETAEAISPPEGPAPSLPSAADKPRLGELRLSDLTPPEIRPKAIPPLLDGIVKQALEANFERTAEDDPSACRATVSVGYALLVNHQPVLEADAGEAQAMFEGEVFCPQPKGAGGDVDAFRLQLDAKRHFGGVSGGTADASLTDAVTSVVRDGAAGLFGQVRMRRASDDAIREALKTSDHPGILAEAASESGERRLVDVVPDLVRLTAHPNTRVSIRAGAALGLLKVATHEVVRALVRMTEGDEPERHLIAIHALADLGTPEAQRYLESLALGHPSPALREVARERLRDLGHALAPEPSPELPPEAVPDPTP